MRCLLYFFLSILTQVSSGTVKVIGLIGHNVTLPCRYDTQSHGILSFCWGQGKVPRSKCSNTVLTSQNGAVVSKQSTRYQLLDPLTEGEMSLTILNAQWSDAGLYGCRVEIPGWFNDYKVNVQLIMEEAPVEQPVTQTWTLSAGKVLTTSAPINVDIGDPKVDMIRSATAEEEFKAFLAVENISRMAAIFLSSIIIILVFIFWRRFLLKGTPEHLNTLTAENIYESLPVP